MDVMKGLQFFSQLAVKTDIFHNFFNFVGERCHGNQNIKKIYTPLESISNYGNACLSVSLFFFLSKVVPCSAA